MNDSKFGSKYRSIIFDLGRVLINWKPEDIIKDIFKDEAEIPMYLMELATGPFMDKVDRGIITYDNVHEYLPAGFDKEFVIKFHRMIPNYLTPIAEGLQIFDAIKARGYKTYILSNFGKEEFEAVSSRYPFLQQFDGGIISYRVNHVKPEPEIYNILLETYGLNPAECLFIDDREDNIAAGKARGIDGIVCSDHATVVAELQRMNVLEKDFIMNIIPVPSPVKELA